MPRTRRPRAHARYSSPSPYLPAVTEAFDRRALQRICQLPETKFAKAFGMERVNVAQEAPADFYLHRTTGSNILAVAHLDTVAPAKSRSCHFVDTEAGPVVYSRALDDRLGAYVILDMLPKLGIDVDVLLTVGEEWGQSTAAFFDPANHAGSKPTGSEPTGSEPTGKQYNWMIEFDRGGTDVVMYQYDDWDTTELVEASGADVGIGSYTDICDLEHLGIKGFNWGVGYQDYHGPRAHAYLDDTFEMVSRFVEFHAANADTRLPHDPNAYRRASTGSTLYGTGSTGSTETMNNPDIFNYRSTSAYTFRTPDYDNSHEWPSYADRYAPAK